jgi:hypothetical protein
MLIVRGYFPTTALNLVLKPLLFCSFSCRFQVENRENRALYDGSDEASHGLSKVGPYPGLSDANALHAFFTAGSQLCAGADFDCRSTYATLEPTFVLR